MTTNERMNLYRYKHFQDPKTGDVRSPFNRGRIQNLIDFSEIRVPGFYPPDRKNWMNLYSINDSSHDLFINAGNNPQYV